LSAKSATEVWWVVGWSAEYRLNRKGDEMALWGTPAAIGAKAEISNPVLLIKYNLLVPTKFIKLKSYKYN